MGPGHAVFRLKTAPSAVFSGRIRAIVGQRGVALVAALAVGATWPACGSVRARLPALVPVIESVGGVVEELPAGVRYVLAEGGRSAAKTWPAYRFGERGSVARVARLARSLGLRGPVQTSVAAWRLRDGARELTVRRVAGLPWKLTNTRRDVPRKDSSPVTPQEAREIFRRVMIAGAGLSFPDGAASDDQDRSALEVTGGPAAWTVRNRIPSVDVGTNLSVTVSGRGRVESGSGVLARLDGAGVYELETPKMALEKVNRRLASGAASREVKVYVERTRTYLVERGDGGLFGIPVFAFATKDGSIYVNALRDDDLATGEQAQLVPWARAAQGGSPGACVDATSFPSASPGNAPLVGRVCVDHTRVRAGESVAFTVTGADPDAVFLSSLGLSECVQQPVGPSFGDREPYVGIHCAGPGPSRTDQSTFTVAGNHVYAAPGVFVAAFALRSAGRTEHTRDGESHANALVTIEVGY